MLFADREIVAGTYYVATDGSDSHNGSITSPWSSFDHAMTVLQPEDTLIIKDGTYYQPLDIQISGALGNPITFRAENDGKAIIDGQYVRKACYIGNSTGTPRIHDITVEGIISKRSKYGACAVMQCDRVILKRVSAYDAAGGNTAVFDLYFSNDCLIEDCAASGNGRTLYLVFECNRTTLRRCWGEWKAWDWSVNAPPICINLYGSDDCVVENCIGANNTSYKVYGQLLWAHTYNPTVNNNKIRGSVYYGNILHAYAVDSQVNTISGNEFRNNVSIGALNGAAIRADTNLTFTNHTAVEGESGFYYQKGDYTGDVNIVLKNSYFAGNRYGLLGYGGINVDNTYNDINNNSDGNYYGHSAEGAGELHIDPGYDTTTYGKGAYLIRTGMLKGHGENGANIGAEIIYRYQDGVLTNVPLWPWPMENRIFAETGTSVTWEKNGGLWKTLSDVYNIGAKAPSIPKKN